MSNRTFCLLLIAFLFAISAGVAAFMRWNQPEDETAQDTFVSTPIAETLTSPTGSWQEAGIFGAQYSERYGQWSLKDEITLKIQSGASIYAPMSGTVSRVEAIAEGGGSVVLQCENDVQIMIWPVYKLRVFEGSRVTQNDTIGFGEEQVSMRIYQNGRVIDPLILTEN